MDERSPQVPRSPLSLAAFTRRVLVVVGVVLVAIAVTAAFVRAADIFFLIFAAVLLAILLRSASDALSRWTGLGAGWALALVVLAITALVAAGLYLLGAMVAGQVNQLSANLPKSVDQARAYLQQYAWGQELLRQAPPPEQLLNGAGGNAAARATAFFSTTLGVLGNLLVLLALALYLAAAPQTYVTGALTLVPPARRRRGKQVLGAIGFQLKWWLAGRLVAMAVVGLVCGVGLWLIGVQQYLVLALLAAVLTAVPFIGPIIAAAPGVLLALMVGPATAGWAVVVYTVAQVIENYIVTPLVQQRTVNMSPVITIASITLTGALFGVLALIVATPLAVALQVAVKMLYVEDVLGDDMAVKGVPDRLTATAATDGG